jgi:hypothetical protein
MVLVDIHQLDIILADPVLFRRLKHQIDRIWRVFSLERQYVAGLGSFQDFCERGQVDPEGDVAVAAERGKGFGAEHQSDQSYMGVVHGLHGDARVIAVKINVHYQWANGLNHLLQH